MPQTQDTPRDDDGAEANVFLTLATGTRILIGLREDVDRLIGEIDELLSGEGRTDSWTSLTAFLYDGRHTEEPVSREVAAAIGEDAAELLPLSYGYLGERSKMVLERMVALRSV